MCQERTKTMGGAKTLKRECSPATTHTFHVEFVVFFLDFNIYKSAEIKISIFDF